MITLSKNCDEYTDHVSSQVNVIATMLGRAKNHPNKTKDMDDAIRIFDKWMKDYKRSKNK